MILCDLYCVVFLDFVSIVRIMIRIGVVNFDWDEVFDIELEDVKEVFFFIYNWDFNFKYRLCFYGLLFVYGCFISNKLKKLVLKMELKGFFYIILCYKEFVVFL